MDRSVDLVVNIIEGRTTAASSMDDVADGAGRMSRAIDDAGAKAERNGKRFAVTADGADNLATKSSVATGALGALASGFELVGLEKYAAGLTSASMATDFFSGVGDSLTLVMESQRLTNIKSAVASRAATVATKAQTIAQRVLNVAMRANPIGLIITAVVALVAGFVLLYRRSETFRRIVQTVGRVGRQAVGWIIEKAGDLYRWVRERLPGAWNWLKDKAVGALRLITAPQRALLDLIQRVVTWVRERVPAAFEKAKDKARAVGDALLSPFRTLKGIVDDVLRLISRIKLPKLPSFSNPFSRLAGGSSARMAAPEAEGFAMMRTAAAPAAASASSASADTGSSGGVTINVYGDVLDEAGFARRIKRALRDEGLRLGSISVAGAR